MTVDNGFQIASKAVIQSGLATMRLGQLDSLRKQPDPRHCRTHYGYWRCVVLDDHFGPCPHLGHYLSKVVGRFQLGDMYYRLAHGENITELFTSGQI